MVEYRKEKKNEITDFADFAMMGHEFRPIVIGAGGDYDNEKNDIIKIQSGSIREAVAYSAALGMHVMAKESYWIAAYTSNGKIYSEHRLQVRYEGDKHDEYSLDTGVLITKPEEGETEREVSQRVLKALAAIAENRI